MAGNLIQRVEETSRELGMDFQVAQFGERSYPIFYGSNTLTNLGILLQQQGIMGKVLIVSHPELKNLFGNSTERSLRASGYVARWATFPSGEQHKNLATVCNLYDCCVKSGVDKNSVIVAIGGGVVQDIANYLSATYMRGINFVQIPTTLLSQADVGIGGCAVNHRAGKSLVGQFYQPRMVVMDTSVLKSLPEKEVTNGTAEIINKVMCLGGLKIKEIGEDIRIIKERNSKTLQEYIKLSNGIKIKIIEQDETGLRGSRLLLDWGHTITYALERALKYSIPHGFALGIGMYGAATLSHQLGYLGKSKVIVLRRTIEYAGLPTRLSPDIKASELIRNMTLDQKVRDSNKRFVLLRDFGSAFVSEPIEDKQIRRCLTEIRKN